MPSAHCRANRCAGFRPPSTTPFTTAPLEDFKDRCLFVSGLDNEVLDTGGNSFVFGHPAKTEAALTGTLTTGAFPTSNTNHISEIRSDAETTGGPNGPSIETLIGQQLFDAHSMPAVNLGVDGYAAASTYGPPDETHTSRFFFEGRGNPITLMSHPQKAHDQLFAGLVDTGPSEAELELTRLRARNKSVLDAVRSSFNELKQGLGREDRTRLEEHAARIRQLAAPKASRIVGS